VFPSVTDTFGLVTIEAAASGLPVAAYRVAGPRDNFGKSPKAGVLARWRNPGQSADPLKTIQLNRLALQKAALKAWKSKLNPEDCRRHAEQFSWERCARLWLENLYLFPLQEQARLATARNKVQLGLSVKGMAHTRLMYGFLFLTQALAWLKSNG
jgi:hypothetical protein